MDKLDELECKIFGGLQFWLQGHPNKKRPRLAVMLGNGISSARYWIWYLLVGRKEEF